MKNHILLVIGLLLVSGFSHAQEWEVGMFIGMANYQGDMAENRIEFGETRTSFGLNLDYIIEPRFRVSGRFYNGTIGGDDANGNRVERGLSFTGQINELSVLGVYMPFATDRLRFNANFKPFVAPKLFIGLGATYSESKVASSIVNDPRFPESGDQSFFLCVPVGAGLHFAFSRHANLGVEAGWRTVFSDHLDGVSETGNPSANDWYFMTGINLSVNLSSALGDY